MTFLSDAHILNLVAPANKTLASSGSIPLTFDRNFIAYIQQSGSLSFTLAGSGNIDGIEGEIVIDGDGATPINVDSVWDNTNTSSFINTKRNHLFVRYRFGEVSFINTTSPLPGLPLVSAVIQNGTNNKIILTFPSGLNTAIIPATTDFVLASTRTVSSVSITGSTVQLTVSSSYAESDSENVSYTQGTNKIQSSTGVLGASFTTKPVVNQIFANSRSLSVGAINQIPKSVGNPNLIQFGDGTNDLPFTLSFWIYKNASGAGITQRIITVADQTDNDKTKYRVDFYTGSDFYISTHSDIAANYILAYVTGLSIATGAWSNVVITYDGSKSPLGIKLFVNNNAITLSTSTGGTYSGMKPFTPTTQLSIGGCTLSGTEYPCTQLLIDNTLIYNKALNNIEISQLYNGGTPLNPVTLASYSNAVGDFRYENSLNDNVIGGNNLTSTVAPTYSTLHA